MPENPKRRPSPMTGYGEAFGISAELVATTAFGVGLGWLADKGLGTTPAFMIVGSLLGGAAGVWRLFKTWSK